LSGRLLLAMLASLLVARATLGYEASNLTCRSLGIIWKSHFSPLTPYRIKLPASLGSLSLVEVLCQQMGFVTLPD